jgi:hypothetical protein
MPSSSAVSGATLAQFFAIELGACTERTIGRQPRAAQTNAFSPYLHLDGPPGTA